MGIFRQVFIPLLTGASAKYFFEFVLNINFSKNAAKKLNRITNTKRTNTFHDLSYLLPAVTA